MEHYKSIVAYDGTDFQGFQRQAPGSRTVQDELEQALRQLGWEQRSLRAAGRTDAGVHAVGQVIAFSLKWDHSSDRLTAALNARLPADVAVRATQVAPASFEPRFSARSRQYRYRLLVERRRNPVRERYLWRIWPAPDRDLLEAASAALIGRHDFGAFGRPPIENGHSVRQLFRAEWRWQQPELSLRLVADAYLNRMVRRIVWALLQVGWSRLDLRDLRRLLENPQRGSVRGLAPAHGLCLEHVSYAESEHGSEKVAEELLPQT